MLCPLIVGDSIEMRMAANSDRIDMAIRSAPSPRMILCRVKIEETSKLLSTSQFIHKCIPDRVS